MPSKQTAVAPSSSDSRRQALSPRESHERAALAASQPKLAREAREPQPRRRPLSPPPPSAQRKIRKPMVFEDEARGENEFNHLGALLVYLRATYGERTGFSALGPAFTITALAVADKLTSYGYPMTSGSYSLLEQGISLPKNPERFFEEIGKVLAVDESSKYWALLRYQYLFDHARRTVGEEFAIDHCPRGRHALDLLKQGDL